MQNVVPLSPVDYLVIGHISCDLTSNGPRLGGTATYAALTARALGLRVGIVTSWGWEVSSNILDGIQIASVTAEHSTTFENVYSSNNRRQILHNVAPDILIDYVPQIWRNASIVHVGPIAGEGKSVLDEGFGASILGVTPQGWMRTWDDGGNVHNCIWSEASHALSKVNAAVISIQDVNGDEQQIDLMAEKCAVLAVTEGAAGARLYWNGDLRRFRALPVEEVDPTGAGDIFAAAFFWRLLTTHDPWAAARFATHLASFSVTRRGLEGIPTREEIQTCLVEVM
jgi:sugar/nucleoside kinase (ribokinase family)